MNRLASILLAILIVPTTPAQHVPCCGEITPVGARLAATLDSMNVESLWLADQHINWETGQPDRGAEYEGPGKHTHCSAFAAAAAKRLGIYLLRPPEHGQQLLSNAQAKWIASEEGRKAGWRPVSEKSFDAMRKAQHLANQGNFVLALYQNPDAHIPGHIAILRPTDKSPRLFDENGPEVIQAGQHNHSKISLRIAFENHPGAWPSGILFYTHSL
jgi:hypothetical protein